MNLLIVGCGYVGQAVARQLLQARPTEQSVVYALTRSPERREELSAQGIQPIVGDWLQSESLGELRRTIETVPAVHVLVAVPHRAVDDLDEQTHVQGLVHLLAAIGPRLCRLVYLSTTGVYGAGANATGQPQRVDEETPLAPTRVGPRIAVAAEQWLQTLHAARLPNALHPAVTILRLAGIYGPGRIPLAQKLMAGEALAVPREGHLNLVHVADIARMLELLLSRRMERFVYVMSDGQPVVRETFYRRLAELCGVESPEFVAPAEDDPRLRRAGDKQVDPTRLIQETGFQFAFPDYRSGLADALSNAQR